MNLFKCLCLIYAQFVDFLISLMFRARMKTGGLTKFVRVAVFSLVSVTMISASPTRCGNENGSLKECHGTALESKLHPTGIQKSSSEILHSFPDFIAAKTAAVADGTIYSTAFETTLKSTSYPGLSRAAHFQEANGALLQAMEGSTEIAGRMQGLGINLERTATGLVPRQSPAGWTWHHAPESGVMQLVPRAQHAPGSIFQPTLHPGGQGGMAIWGQ